MNMIKFRLLPMWTLEPQLLFGNLKLKMYLYNAKQDLVIHRMTLHLTWNIKVLFFLQGNILLETHFFKILSLKDIHKLCCFHCIMTPSKWGSAKWKDKLQELKLLAKPVYSTFFDDMKHENKISWAIVPLRERERYRWQAAYLRKK
jgi:hypothetical protein